MMKKISRLFCATLVFTMTMGSFAACGKGNEETKYNDARALIESGEYERAYAAFKELGDYKDSEKYLSRFVYFPTVANYALSDRSGSMTIELGVYNMPSRMLTVGVEGPENAAYTKDGVYTYDSEGNLTRQAVTYNGTLLAYDYTYDGNHNLIKAEYSVEGVVGAVNDYVYDENGLLVRESYREGNVVYYDFVNSYDVNGNQIKSEYQAPEGAYVYTYTYNAQGYLVNEHGSVPSGDWYNVDYTYAADGNLTQGVRTENEGAICTTNYTYDNAGNCIKEESVYPDGSRETFTWEFDANGNLTKEQLTDTDGTVETVDWQYALTYLTMDIPASTMDQILGVFDMTL